MPRNEITCALSDCNKRIEGTMRKYKVTLASHKDSLEQYRSTNNLTLGKSGVVCSSCHVKVLNPQLNSSEYRTGLVLNRSSRMLDQLAVVDASPNAAPRTGRSDRSNFVDGSQSSVSTSATTDVSSSRLSDTFTEADIDNGEERQVDFSQDDQDQLGEQSQRACTSASTTTVPTSLDASRSGDDPDARGSPSTGENNVNVSQSLSSQSLQSTHNDSQVSSITPSAQIVNYVELSGSTILKGNDKRCFICPTKPNPQPPLSRSRIPSEAKASIYYSDKVYVPSNLRCCPEHLEEGQFTSEAKAAKTKPSPHPLFDFTRGNVEHEYLTSLDQKHFEILHSIIEPYLRNSTNRDTRQALASFLILLRHGQPQKMIGLQLGMSQQVESDAIESVSNALYDNFVPQYLGYNHMTREEALKTHSRHTCFDIPEDKMAVVMEGTYLFKDKPGNIQEQIDSYSGQKKQNFDRYAVIVLASGYCVDVVGPFPAKVNDAECLNTMLEDQDFVRFLGDGAHLFVDRGYRDCIDMLKANGYVPHVPDFLAADQAQFTAQQANHSRKVTKTRWVVEAKNGQFKEVLKFFMGRIHGGYKVKTPKFFKIAMALLNFSRPVPYTETERSIKMVQKIKDIADANAPNALKEKIDVLQCLDLRCQKWTKMNANDYPNFPTIDSLEDFQDEITLGPYQCNIASRYIDEHIKADGDFTIMVHECIGNIVRAQIKSRMSQPGKDCATFVEYDPELVGAEAIVDTWCQCIQGQRQAGCCANVATVLRYLMYDRHHPIPERQRRKRPKVEYLETKKIMKPKLDVAGPSKSKKPKKQASKSVKNGKAKRRSTAPITQARSAIESLDDGQSDAEAELALLSQ